MRVYVYVDGFNFYYRALKQFPQYKWVDLAKLSARLLNPEDTVEAIRYFTARVSPRAGDPDAPRRQQILFGALGTIPNLHFHYGRFLPKTKRRPLVAPPHTMVEVQDTEEKGTDVNLAAHLINDVWMNRYDAALLLSQDSDLIEPLRIVKSDIKKVMGLVWLDGGSPNRHMKNAASFVRHLSHADLAASQFPNPIVRPDGSRIDRPATW